MAESTNERWDRLVEQTRRAKAKNSGICRDPHKFVAGIRRRLLQWGKTDDPAAGDVPWWNEDGLDPEWLAVPSEETDKANDRYEALNRRNAQWEREYATKQGEPLSFEKVRGKLSEALRRAKARRHAP